MEIELDLSLCTVAERQSKGLRGLLASVYATAFPVAFEVIVAEIGESGSAALVDDFPGLLVARLTGCSWLAAANHALSLGRGRYTALVDADLLVQPGCLERLVGFMDDNPDVGLASPRILDAYGKTEPSCHPFPRLLRGVGLPLPATYGLRPAATAEVDWCRAGLHLLRRELIEEIGLLDEHCAGLAELDLYWRAKRQGWHNYAVYEAVVVHANPGRYHPELAEKTAWPERLREGLSFLKRRWLG